MRRPAYDRGFFLGVLLVLSGCARSAHQPASAPPIPGTASTYLQHSAEAVATLQTWYQPKTGLYATTGWWNAANAITVLADYDRVAHATEYNAIFANTFAAAQTTSPRFLNKFYDDEGWWALAWIDAYDLTRDQAYLSMAESIFADMAASWDDTCAGGIWWSKDRNYKNAIANELFLSVAAHLTHRTSGAARQGYLQWSAREWKWFQASSMINADGLVNDGLRIASGACTNNGRTTWTYNQGVVLGGLTEYAEASSDPALLRAADRIAHAAITRLADARGVLHDPCEPKCGADGVQFKGIFVRNLALLQRAHPHRAYRQFLRTNADSIWQNAQGPHAQLGQQWSGPFIASDAASQTSALDALIAASSTDP